MVLKYEYDDGNTKHTYTKNYDDFVPGIGKTYVVGYDDVTKVFSFEEGRPTALAGEMPQRAEKNKRIVEAFLQQYPDAVKLHFQTQGKGQVLDVPKINGTLPARFTENGKKGIYLAPGVEHEMNLLCEQNLQGKYSGRKRITTDVIKIIPETQKIYVLRHNPLVGQFEVAFQ